MPSPETLWLIAGGIAFYLILFLVDRKWGRRLLNRDFNDRERAMAASIMKSEQAYVEMQATIKTLNRALEDKDEQLIEVRASSFNRDKRIGELMQEVHRLEREVADLKRQLEEKKVIDKPPVSPAPTKVLMVAPRSNLAMVGAETEDVQRSGLAVTPVYSPIDQVRLTREIRSGNFEGLWLAGHMDKDGNFLLDGELLSSSALTALVRGRFSWVYLNTCHSIIAAQMLQNESDCDLICTIVEVPDIDAYRTGSLFANALARTGDTRLAYDQSRPGNNRIYLYLAGTRKKG